MLLSDTFDTLAIFRDVSLGDIITKTICLSITDCKDDPSYVIITGEVFPFTYPEYDKYFISMEVVDQFANIASKRRALTTSS